MGWIKLDRKLLDNEIWLRKPFSWGQAWVDLLMLANHEDHTAFIGGEIADCKRGEVNRSQRWLAERWGWSRAQVRHFLTTIEANHSATINTYNKKTVVTIENYEKYQGQQPTKRPQSEPRSNHERDTYKKYKELKKVVVDACAREDSQETADDSTNVNNQTITSAPRLFTPPLPFELHSFCEQENLQVDIERFFKYYHDLDWKTKNGKPITDWKQKLRDWDKADAPKRKEEEEHRKAVERGRKEQEEREAKLEEEFLKELEKRKKRVFTVVK